MNLNLLFFIWFFEYCTGVDCAYGGYRSRVIVRIKNKNGSESADRFASGHVYGVFIESVGR